MYGGAMNNGARVALRRNPEWTGVVDRTDRRGLIHVTGDSGWKGKVEADDLVETSEKPTADEKPVHEDKSWPPKDMEQK